MLRTTKLTWSDLYREVELCKSAVRLYTKPLQNKHVAPETETA